MTRLLTAVVAALLVSAPAAAQRTPAPGDCAVPAACGGEIRKGQEQEAGQHGNDDDTRRFDAIHGSGPPGNGQLAFGVTVAQTTMPDHGSQSLRTAHRLNQQGIRTAQRGDWIGALQLFETAARYAPHDPVIQRNLAEARVRAARQAEELKRQRQQR